MPKIPTPKKQFNSIEDLKKEIKKTWEKQKYKNNKGTKNGRQNNNNKHG